jgi:hypothetical protein
MSEHYHANPPWADKLIAANWDALAERVGEPMLPREGRETDSHVEWAPITQCGFHGCVYFTNTPGVIFKVTDDEAEAKFVQKAMSMPWPDGMVQYYDAVELDTKGGEKRYALWREEAFKIGANLKRGSASDMKLMNWLINVRDLASPMYLKIWWEGEDLIPAFRRKASFGEKAVDDTWVKGNWRASQEAAVARASNNGELAAIRIALIRRGCYEMSKLKVGANVGKTMLYYIDEGAMILGDVHGNNVGEAHRGKSKPMVITDPGHMVPLNLANFRIKLPKLKA